MGAAAAAVAAAMTLHAIALPAPAGASGGAAPATGPATQRTAEAIGREFGQVVTELRKVLPTAAVYDAEKRAAAAERAIPLVRREVALVRELAAADPKREATRESVEARSIPLLALLGDPEAKATLDAWAASAGGGGEAHRAAAGLLMIRWWNTPEDEAARAAWLDEAERLARAGGHGEPLGRAVMEAVRSPRMLTAQRDRALALLAEHLKGQTADGVRADVAARERLAGLTGKPITIAGVRHDGKPFSTADLKGKVILVDFWATWCVPCVAELPRVKAVYAKHHSEGLEVLGISCDEKESDLLDYLTKNPDMPWPQLFDKDKPGWHVLCEQYGVRGIPTMFLIDRKGVVRSVTARETFEQDIPQLLAERE
jgi:thiol-disulfide isomerase/thioredoxin